MIRLQTLGREQLRPALLSGRGADAAQINSVTEAGANAPASVISPQIR